MSTKLKYLLLLLYIVEFTALAIHPYDRGTWWAENIPMVLIVATLALTHKRFEFSAGSYFAMSILVFLHTVGGHYTFERVPFEWAKEFFGFERNQYDRFAHFSVGFYAYAVCEFIERKNLSHSRWITALFAIFSIFTVAAIYEIIEWLYAAFANQEAGAAFLGSQGDQWDAQKDMLADGCGAILATFIFFAMRQAKKERLF